MKDLETKNVHASDTPVCEMKRAYQQPVVRVVEVRVEKGYATSGTVEPAKKTNPVEAQDWTKGTW